MQYSTSEAPASQDSYLSTLLHRERVIRTKIGTAFELHDCLRSLSHEMDRTYGGSPGRLILEERRRDAELRWCWLVHHGVQQTGHMIRHSDDALTVSMLRPESASIYSGDLLLAAWCRNSDQAFREAHGGRDTYDVAREIASRITLRGEVV